MNEQSISTNNTPISTEAKKKIIQNVLNSLDPQTLRELLSNTNTDPQDVSSTTGDNTPRRGRGNILRNIQDSNSRNSVNRDPINRLEQTQQINSRSSISDLEHQSENESPMRPEEEDGDGDDEGSEWPETPAETNQEDTDTAFVDAPNEIEDFAKILESLNDPAFDQADSTFVLNLMRDLFRLNKDKERFLCARCLVNEIGRKGKAKENKHWFPFRSLLRHLMKAHVSEFKKNEKEFLKHIGFFNGIDKNDSNHNRVISQFRFGYSILRDLSKVYCSVKDYNIRKKNKILGRLSSKLKEMLGKDSDSKNISRPMAKSSGFDNNLTPLETKKEIKKENKRVTRSDGKRGEQNLELNEEEKNEVLDGSIHMKTPHKTLRGSNKRVGADISEEDAAIKKIETEGNMIYLQKFFELSCEKSAKEKELQEEIAREKEENRKLREKLEKYKQRLVKYTNEKIL